jgi:hypothetical protein
LLGAASIQAFGVFVLMLISIGDLLFLAHPPFIARHSELCPGIVWSDVK